MLQAFNHTPEAKMDPKNPPFLKAHQLDSFSSGDYQHNNYTRYSENSQFSQISQNSQSSFFTPSGNSGKKNPVLDDITNLLMNVHPKKLDFSAGPDPNNNTNKNMTPNYLIRKFDSEILNKNGRPDHEEITNQDRPFNMEIEDLVFSDNGNNQAIDSEKAEIEEGHQGVTMMDDMIYNINNNEPFKRVKISKNNSNEGFDLKYKNPSLIKRWKKSDKIFEGKYSTGATPKFSKNSPSHQMPLPLIPFKRCNTDVPPTFESDKLLMAGDKTEIGVNKYINNLMGTTEINKPRGQSFGGAEILLKQPHLKPLIAPMRQNSSVLPRLPSPNFHGQNTNKPKLLRDFPLNFTQNMNFNIKPNNHHKQDQGLFLIPEKNIEYDSTANNKLAQLDFHPKQENAKTKKRGNDFVSKLLTFDEGDDEIIEEDQLTIENPNTSDTQIIRPDYGRQDEQDTEIFGRQTFSVRQNNNFTSPSSNKVYNTPTKKSPFHINFSLLDSVTAKKEAHSKLFPKDFDSSDKIRPFEFENRGGFDDVISEGDENGQNGRSRFEVDYEVIEVLGSGHFGTVYKCQNKLDGLIYAVKCTKNKLKGTSNINQALNEAQALASLSALGENPFIVRYYSAWIEDDRLYLAMEHCQSNLNSLRRQHIRFSESMIRQIMRNICMGLRHLHNQKIVHLDIKPENILYSKTNKFKIADLGLSRIALRSNHEDINEGDCRFLAPELLRDYPDHQLPDLTKADIFSFGATIYELITGTDLPRNGIEWSNLRAGNLTKLDHLNYSNSLKSMLRSMMDSNPDLRPSANELLTNYLQSEIELELKWEKKENKLLKEKVKELEQKLNACKACKAKRKNSI